MQAGEAAAAAVATSCAACWGTNRWSACHRSPAKDPQDVRSSGEEREGVQGPSHTGKQTLQRVFPDRVFRRAIAFADKVLKLQLRTRRTVREYA